MKKVNSIEFDLSFCRFSRRLGCKLHVHDRFLYLICTGSKQKWSKCCKWPLLCNEASSEIDVEKFVFRTNSFLASWNSNVDLMIAKNATLLFLLLAIRHTARFVMRFWGLMTFSNKALLHFWKTRHHRLLAFYQQVQRTPFNERWALWSAVQTIRTHSEKNLWLLCRQAPHAVFFFQKK